MPIYEYQCTNCHHQFDLMQKVNEEPAKKCPQCSEFSLVKLVSAAGFQLKGTGWYATDFKNKTSSVTKESSDSKTKENKSTNDSSKEGTVTTSTTKGSDE